MLNQGYVPVNWNGEALTTDKLNQMCNNDQYLYDRSPRIRFSINGAGVRDTSIKMISGKTPYAPTAEGIDNEWLPIYFGSFFTAGCNPVVVANAEPSGFRRRVGLTVAGLNNSTTIDSMGFQAIVWDAEVNQVLGSYIDASGWIHWTATGY